MISIIAAISENNCIGKDGTLPWHIPADLAHFKQHTTGKTVLMGRSTWESLPAAVRPLPNRTNIVITRNNAFPLPPKVERYTDIKAAIQAHSSDTSELMIIGGASIYEQTIELVDRLYITHIHDTIVDGDAFFPPIEPTIWKEMKRDDHINFSFVTYERY